MTAPAPHEAVPLPQAYRLMNHGPTVLIGARHDGRDNVMAAAWAMPLDFDPPKVAVVLDAATFTRRLIEASGHFTVSVPCVAQAELVRRVGQSSGADTDKFAQPDLQTLDGPQAHGPLVAGCVAWLDCRVLPQPDLAQRHDLFLGEVLGAWADPRVFRQGRWHFASADAGLRTLHHVAGGHFLAIGADVPPP